MSAIVVAGDTSGSVTLQAPAVSGTTVITLPATSGTMALSGGSGSFTTVEASSTIKGGSTIAVGGATPAASGAGITFPATQSASTNANTLDDYEEGTFTATLTGSTTNPSTPVTATATYTKIGNVVNFKIYFNDVNTTGASGSIIITGLPFTPQDGYRVLSPCVFYSIGTFTGSPVGMIDFTLPNVYFYGNVSNAAWSAVTHNAGATRYLGVSGFYNV